MQYTFLSSDGQELRPLEPRDLRPHEPPGGEISAVNIDAALTSCPKHDPFQFQTAAKKLLNINCVQGWGNIVYRTLETILNPALGQDYPEKLIPIKLHDI